VNDDMNTEDVILPELTDARVDEIEEALFAAIATDREAAHRDGDVAAARARRVRRGRIWLGAGAAAAIVVVAAVIAPSMPALLGGASSASTAENAPDVGGIRDGAGVDLGGGAVQSGGGSVGESDEGSSAPDAEREIIATASATVRVDDAAAAAERIGDDAEALGGYVEAMSIGGEQLMPYAAEGDAAVPLSASNAWITVRVPAAQLADATAALGEIGDVTASQIDRRDVTSEAVDLRARIDALSASVERLTSLVAKAGSTSELIAAEEALASRQADLESYQQQLKYLDEQVGMSTLTVSLFEPSPAVEADPAGFGDGIAAGWNGLLATMNGFVLAFGFLLPWLAVIAVIAAIVWLIRRGVRRRRTTHDIEPGDAAG
jgi:hypothetical protein